MLLVLLAGHSPDCCGCWQDIPLNVPKKTKLYVEQTQRERDSGVDMHRIFQRELCKLRLNTARAYVKVRCACLLETSERASCMCAAVGVPLYERPWMHHCRLYMRYGRAHAQ